MQVAEAIHKYAKGVGVTVLPLYGGAPMHQQIRALERGADVVVATPGRALDHIRRGTLKLDAPAGAGPRRSRRDARHGLRRRSRRDPRRRRPETRQTALFSATMPARILAIAGRHLKNPARVTIAREKTAAGKLPRVRQSRLHRRRAPQAGDARPRARHGGSGRHAGVLPHAARSRIAGRDAQRARPPRRGAARRHEAAASATA